MSGAYKLLRPAGVLRTEDQASIPENEQLSDWRAYLDWLADGNAPDPADPIDTTPQQTAVFAQSEDDERLRLVAERSQTDPAFAALAELVLGGVSR